MAFDQKPNIPANSPSAPELTPSTVTTKERKGKGPLVIAGVGGAAILAVIAGFIATSHKGEEAPSSQPTASAPANPNTPSESVAATPEATKTTSAVKLPVVSNEGLYITDTEQAQAVANSTARGATTPVEPLVAALRGDGSFLDRMHIDINEIVLNYNLNALYLKDADKVIDAAKAEVPAASTTFDFSTITSNYDNTRATQYLLGELIAQYKEGKQPQLDTKYPLCIDTTGANTVLPDGTLETGFFPPLGIASATEESLCETNDTTTKAIIDQMPYYARTGIKLATDAGLPNIAKLSDIEANVNNFRSLKAKAYFEEFKANVSVK